MESKFYRALTLVIHISVVFHILYASNWINKCKSQVNHAFFALVSGVLLLCAISVFSTVAFFGHPKPFMNAKFQTTLPCRSFRSNNRTVFAYDNLKESKDF